MASSVFEKILVLDKGRIKFMQESENLYTSVLILTWLRLKAFCDLSLTEQQRTCALTHKLL